LSVVAYLPLLLAWLVAVVSPGPDFLAVLRTSAAGSRRAGTLVAVGVVSGIACWALAALAGLTALLARYEQLYLVLRLAGAAFLIVYGLTTLRAAWRRGSGASDPTGRLADPVEGADLGPAEGADLGSAVPVVSVPPAETDVSDVSDVSAVSAGATGAAPHAPTPAGWRSWRLGLFTNLANPKAVVFFGALFASLLPPHADLLARGEVLVTMLVLAFAWFVLVASLASVPSAMAAYRRGRRAIDTVTGGLFVALGGALVPR
jgi:threonine efflux protein